MQVTFSATNMVGNFPCKPTEKRSSCWTHASYLCSGQLWSGGLFITCTTILRRERGSFQKVWAQSWKKIAYELGCMFGWCAPMHGYKPERVFQQDLRAPESHFTAQSSSLLVSNPTLSLLLPYNLSLPVSSVKNCFSWLAETAAAAYPIYLPSFCAPLGRVPRANASLVVPLLLLFEAY